MVQASGHGGMIAVIMQALWRWTIALMVYASTYTAFGGGAERSFQRTTVAAILKSPKQFDGKLVELLGRISIGDETSILREPSACPNMNQMPCAIWADFSRCASCGTLVERIAQAKQGRAGLSETPDVIVRGTVHTVRRDVSYDRSARRSDSIGFGHLGAYPAEISIEEVVLSSN